MSFLEPTRLWLLLVVPLLLVVYAVLQFRKSRYAVLFTNMALLDTVAPRRVRWRQHVAVMLALLTLSGAVVLFAKPTRLVNVPRQTPVTVVLTIDVSLSMEATDVSPTRLAAAKRTATDFLNKLPSTYQVAVVSFAKHARVVVRPTLDRAEVSTAVNALRVAAYTATGEGIFTALDVVKQSLAGVTRTPGEKLPAMIVLISDGKRTVGRSQVSAAEAAKAQHVPVYTVALGTPDGMIQAQDQTVPVPVQIGELQQVAMISGGKSYVASNSADLLSAYQDVHGALVYVEERGDATSEYMGYLVLLSLISTAAGLFVASRWP
ncbi:MAG: VWA domain-containing protein [Nocardioidaceae bacterium]